METEPRSVTRAWISVVHIGPSVGDRGRDEPQALRREGIDACKGRRRQQFCRGYG